MKPSTQQTRRRRLRWLNRGGGPFVVVPAEELDDWNGLTSSAYPSDFDRACDVTDYLGVIDFADGQALVLGDDPFPTTFLAGPSFGGGYLIRMLWGDDTSRAVQAVHELPSSAWTAESLTFDAASGSLVMFDAANSGHSLPRRVEVPIGPGQYAIDSADFQPDESICVMVHRLVPLS